MDVKLVLVLTCAVSAMVVIPADDDSDHTVETVSPLPPTSPCPSSPPHHGDNEIKDSLEMEKLKLQIVKMKLGTQLLSQDIALAKTLTGNAKVERLAKCAAMKSQSSGANLDLSLLPECMVVTPTTK
ncbi:uncharacterized protein LOC143298346 [Babylonia areolata]|uniref:uncharacterized protein LOC143298346 n=1 Tax=Babylonia areolata TaxID=304850 RepID=UPI003FD039E0